MSTDLEVRRVTRSDEHRWAELFAGYRDFYRLGTDSTAVARTWEWVVGEQHGLTGLVAVSTTTGELLGLANLRMFARPSTGTIGLYLDDLFADPAARRRGVGAALLDARRTWPRSGARASSGGSPPATTRRPVRSTTSTPRRRPGSPTTCRPPAAVSGSGARVPSGAWRSCMSRTGRTGTRPGRPAATAGRRRAAPTRTSGFIHASSRAQLPAVAAFVFAGDSDELCVLFLDTDTITAAGVEVRYEDGGSGELYPHVYGPIDPAWVVDVVPAHLGPDGVFAWGPAPTR